MALSDKDRSRAKRVRAALRLAARGKGKPPSARDRAWLDAYDSNRRGRPTKLAEPPAPSDAPAPLHEEQEPPTPNVEPASDDAERVEVDDFVDDDAPTDPSDDDDGDDDDDEHDDEHEHDAGTCTIVDCIACEGRDIIGPQKCGKTGRMVWPRMSRNGARALAGGIFFVLGWVIKTWRGLEEIPEPTELEMEDLADALVDIARRRIGALSAFDDLLSSLYSLGSFSKRARALPRPKADALARSK